MKRFGKIFLSLAVLFTSLAVVEESFAHDCFRSPSSKKSTARNIINKTAYVIDQAYDVVHFYNYWTNTYLSKAVYYNEYAQRKYRNRAYSSAINYSLRAREYALYVLDNCDDYWEFFYYTYYGWSHLYGYNPSFAYAHGYRNGYYDGYYAAYCHRHHHDYRHDPHYRPNGRYHEYNHGHHTKGGAVIGRGNTGPITTNNNGGTVTRPGFVPSKSVESGNYKNLNLAEYFSDEEVSMLKDIPNETNLETDFKKENPNVTFNDKALSTNKAIMERNKAKSEEFAKETKNTNKSILINKPAKITTGTKELNKGNNKENSKDKEFNRETKPTTTINKELDSNKDSNKPLPKPAKNSNSNVTNFEKEPSKGNFSNPEKKNNNNDSKELKGAINDDKNAINNGSKTEKGVSKPESKPAKNTNVGKNKETKKEKSYNNNKSKNNKSSKSSKSVNSSSKTKNSSSKTKTGSAKQTKAPSSSSKRSSKTLSR
jgi:hypothetical protein